MSLKFTIPVTFAAAALCASQAFSVPPDNAGGQDPIVPYQERKLSAFDDNAAQNVARLNFSNPVGAGQVLVIEFASASLTTDPDAIQAVVDLQVLHLDANGVAIGVDVNHRLVLTAEPPTGAGGTQAWVANQPILVFVNADQAVDIVCTTNPPPQHVAAGCIAAISGYIRELAN